MRVLQCSSAIAQAMIVSQHFIELLRHNRNGEALKWLREKMSPLRENASPEVLDILQDCCVLLIQGADSWKDIKCQEAALGFEMFHSSRRVLCAELVVAASVKVLLDFDDRIPQWSPLHFALRHNVVLRQAIHVRNNGRGPVVCPRHLCCG